jgi:hypothetical protein
MLECAIGGPSAAGAGRLASRLFFRIELMCGEKIHLFEMSHEFGFA